MGLQPPERQGMVSSCQSLGCSLSNRPKELELLFLMLINVGQAQHVSLREVCLPGHSSPPPLQLKGPKAQQGCIQHCPQSMPAAFCENSIGIWTCSLLSPMSKMVPAHSVINQMLVARWHLFTSDQRRVCYIVQECSSDVTEPSLAAESAFKKAREPRVVPPPSSAAAAD